jgi:hypothetical protein
VFAVRPRPENTRHECFVVDASVSVKIAETAEMDDEQQRSAAPRWLLLTCNCERLRSSRRHCWYQDGDAI